MAFPKIAEEHSDCRESTGTCRALDPLLAFVCEKRDDVLARDVRRVLDLAVLQVCGKGAEIATVTFARPRTHPPFKGQRCDEVLDVRVEQ